MVRQTDDGQNAVRDRSLLDTKVIGAGGRLHGDLVWFHQNDIFRTVFPVNGEPSASASAPATASVAAGSALSDLLPEELHPASPSVSASANDTAVIFLFIFVTSHRNNFLIL